MSEIRDMIIRCKKDENFGHTRNVGFSCNLDFKVNEDDIFSILSPGYFGEDEREYYVICPTCGYINSLNQDILSDEVKDRINARSDSEPFLYRKSNLRSELIYLDRISRGIVLKRQR